MRKLPSLSSMKSQSFVSTLMKTFLQEMLLLHVVLRQNYVIVTCLICKFIGGDYLISSLSTLLIYTCRKLIDTGFLSSFLSTPWTYM